MSEPIEFYEVLPEIYDETGETKLHAAFTPNNGIRIQLSERPFDGTAPDGEELGQWTDWRCFDFNDAQAELIGHALVRWAQRDRAETELVRCGMRIKKT